MADGGTHRIARRTFLKAFGGMGLAAGFGPRLFESLSFAHPEASELAKILAETLSPDLQVYLYRREDLLDLRFDLYNLELTTSGGSAVLVPTASPAWVVVVFPFQALGEYDTLVGSTPPSSYTNTPVSSLATGPSQLAFEVPAGVTSIPFTVAGLLDWQALSPLLPAVSAAQGAAAATDPTGSPTSTSPPLTYIEMAWQLLVAPDPQSTWASASAPVANGSWTELWQARLTRYATTVAAGSNGGNIVTVASWSSPSAGVLDVVSTTGFPPSGTLVVQTSAGTALVAYTGLSGGDEFTGCTLVSGTGTVSTGGEVAQANPADPSLYAVWTPQYGSTAAPVNDPFPMSLSFASNLTVPSPVWGPQNRLGLVGLSSYVITPNGHFNGTAALAPTFMLTGLGATADVRGSYDNVQVSDIVSWHHKMSVGRDTYVRVVLAGFLFPFGHRAVLVQTTDREFQVSPDGDVVAYLIERQTVQVTQPVVVYPYPDEGAVPQAWGGRQNPFTQIEVKTTNTPPLDVPPNSDSPQQTIGTVPFDDAQWVNVGGQPYPFAMVGTDAEGRRVDFTTAAIWVAEGLSQLDIFQIWASYVNADNLAWRNPLLGGQLLAFAPPAPGSPGATALHVDSLLFDALPYDGTVENNSTSTTSPPWYPVVSSAEVRLPALSQLSGAAGDDATPGPQISYNPTYLENGFQAGLPEVFLDIGAPNPALDFSQSAPQSAQSGTSLSGGLVAPNFTIDGFARDLGPISDTADLVAGNFDPSTFFGGLDATILGAISLSEILGTVTAGPRKPGARIEDGPLAGQQAPTINSVPIYPPGASDPPTQPPIAVQTTINWAPTIQEAGGGTFQPGDVNGLTVNVVIYAPLNGGSPTYTIDGQLQTFTLQLFGSAASCVEVAFATVHFSSRTGSKSNVEVSVTSVTFTGPLSFIQDFAELFGSLGGPSIDLEPSGINASYSVSIPSIGLGVFALENLSLGGSLNIPFTGQPVRLEVDFCSRDNPFILAIYIFAGGGWLGIRLGADGIELVEVGLEFGASVSLDLGVASGGVSVMAGIYFALGSDSVTLTGFFKASGNLEVLGIISISIVFYLALTYQNPPSAAYGTASVSVTVSVLCFSASVTLTVTKQIAGSDPVITFPEAITSTNWHQYCASFA